MLVQALCAGRDRAPERAARADRLGPGGPGGQRRRAWVAALAGPGLAGGPRVDRDDGRGMRTMPFTEWITRELRRVPTRWLRAADAEVPAVRRRALGVVRSDDQAGSPTGTSTSRTPACAGTTARWPGWTWSTRIWTSWYRPDRSWEWKDEEEFVERLAFPEHYWVTDEAAVRAEGERVIKQIEAARVPVRRHLGRLRTRPLGWSAPVVRRTAGIARRRAESRRTGHPCARFTRRRCGDRQIRAWLLDQWAWRGNRPESGRSKAVGVELGVRCEWAG